MGWGLSNSTPLQKGQMRQIQNLLATSLLINCPLATPSVSGVSICGFMPCAVNAYRNVNHDYEAYENEVLRLLFT